jgi:hypothetical protein
MTRHGLLRDLLAVGPTKPIGYLPIKTLEQLVQLAPDAVAATAAARGLATAQFGPEACCIKSGALYVYDREALASLLQHHLDSVLKADLPPDPDRFVACIAANWFDEDHPAYPIIERAFGATRGRPDH